jgi:thiol-disulfide isomerase/thioredoxin
MVGAMIKSTPFFSCPSGPPIVTRNIVAREAAALHPVGRRPLSLRRVILRRIGGCALALGALAQAACHRETPAATTASVPRVDLGTYRAVLTLPGGDLPFGLEIEREGSAAVAYLLNGGERLRVTEVTIAGPHLDIRMPGYENRLIADAQGGELQGEIILDKMGGKQQHIPLHAKLGRGYRFFEGAAGETTGVAGQARVAAGPAAVATDQAPSSHGNVSGRWAVNFIDDAADAKPEVAVGEFTQTGDVVSGTFLTATGDHRFLGGQIKDDELYLSTFDGAHAFLYKAKIGADGTLAGDFWSGTAYHERWTGRRDASAALPDAYALTSMRTGAKHLDFAFPDLAGNTVTSHDPAFKGKVIIVALAGSWCPNCHDEAAFLAPLYRDYRGKGVEIVSLMFEHFGDFPRAAAATQRFRQHYGIEYTTLIAGVSDKDEAAKVLPMLDHVYAFPTTIFIDRKGNVRKIHTGFSGPATGDHYTQFVNEVKDTLDRLLAES